MLPTEITTPRSTLHALTPIGLGSSDVESLTSYFCRLAHSHSVSATQLARWILEHQDQCLPLELKWNQRNFVSADEETQRWAGWLSELTGVGNLDHLTFLPWRQLIGSQGLAPKSDRWCPCCLAEDLAMNRTPYLRLAWDVAAVTACHTHKVALSNQCPHCQRTNIRSRASLVVPGYCTACGGFLGSGLTEPATPESMWVSRQVGQMLSRPPLAACSEARTSTLEAVIQRMAAGRISNFSQLMHLSKSSVSHWLTRGGLPTLRSWLCISLNGGIGLEKLMNGDLANWVLPVEPPQMTLGLPASPRKGIGSRTHDWDEIRRKMRDFLQLEEPLPLTMVCKSLDLDVKLVRLRACEEARSITALYKQHVRLKKDAEKENLRRHLEATLSARLAAGYDGMSARDVLATLRRTEMANVRHLFSSIRDVKAANS